MNRKPSRATSSSQPAPLSASGAAATPPRGRLLNLVRYIFEQRPDGIEYGALAMTIYLADREAYVKLGHVISGSRHIRRPWGVDIAGLRRVIAYMRRRGELVPHG